MAEVEEHRIGDCCVEVSGDRVLLAPPRLDFAVMLTPAQAYELGCWLVLRFWEVKHG